jgi:hypothetical protein
MRNNISSDAQQGETTVSRVRFWQNTAQEELTNPIVLPIPNENKMDRKKISGAPLALKNSTKNRR